MRLPLQGLVCVLIAAGCSTNKTPETVDSTTLATSDTTVTTEAPDSSELALASSEDTSTAHTANAEAPTANAEAPAANAEAPTAHAPRTIDEPAEQTHATDTSRNEPNAAPATTRPDNTKVNTRDTDSAALTPIDQGGNASDLKVTQQIRQAVMADGSLSFTAKNVKIITVNGKVTLRGPVKTAAERASIEGAARKVAGPAMVDSQLELAP